MDKMALIVYAKTGHVLGALTRTVDPAGAVSADAVVGVALQVREPGSGAVMAHVEPQHLKLEIADRRDDVVLLHRRYVLEDGLPTERSPLTVATPLAYGATGLTVTIDAAPADEIVAWVQLEDGTSQPNVVSVPISPPNANGTVPLTLSAGTTYHALALVPGFAVYTGSFTA